MGTGGSGAVAAAAGGGAERASGGQQRAWRALPPLPALGRAPRAQAAAAAYQRSHAHGPGLIAAQLASSIAQCQLWTELPSPAVLKCH